jgi:hypothetical protein
VVVKRHGLSGWDDYKSNNAGDSINRYGDDCLPGVSASGVFDALTDALSGDNGGGAAGGVLTALLIGGAIWWAKRRWLS